MCEFDFDRCSGVISNPHVIYPEITTFPYNRVFWEGAYSPNDSVFYATTSRASGNNYGFLLQYDLTATDISASCDTLDSATVPIGTGAVRLAPDGKIYYSRAYESPGVNSFPYKDTMYNYINMNLSVINEPDNPGAACNYQPFSFYLGGKRTYYGLPNNPDYDLGALTGSVCDTLTGISPLYPPKGDLINIYPNPVNNILFISGLSDAKNELVVYDIYGRLIIEKQTNGTNGSIDVSSLSDGVYNLRIKNETGEYFKKRFVVIK